MRGFERSGLVGVGDVEAVKALQEIWSENHLGRIEGIHYGPENESMVTKNLILFGGPDANWATNLIAGRLGGVIEFGDAATHSLAITDRKAGRVFSADIDLDQGNGTDYGVIKYGPNPYKPSCKVLIVAGEWGYGTWAGALLMQEEAFLSQPEIWAESFECLYRVEVVGGGPVKWDIVATYPVAAANQRQASAGELRHDESTGYGV